MIEVDITDDMMNAARKKAKEMGLINNSILKSAGSIAGFLGEQVVLSIVGGEWCNTYDYDLISDKGNKIDVKTKQTTVKPKLYYEASVANFNTKQKCDYYAFVRIHKNYSTAWYMGSMLKEKYYELATFIKKGAVDPVNHFVVRADCYHLALSDLKEFEI